MAEFDVGLMDCMHAVELGYKPLSAFFSCELRPHPPDVARGLVPTLL